MSNEYQLIQNKLIQNMKCPLIEDPQLIQNMKCPLIEDPQLIQNMKCPLIEDPQLIQNMKCPFRIAIPTYLRPREFCLKTWTFLLSQDIEPNEVNIFVANEDEKKRYISEMTTFWMNSLKCKPISERMNRECIHDWTNQIVIGVPGMKHIRNFMMKYYPTGYPIVQMDDDIEDFYVLKDCRLVNQKNIDTKEWCPLEKHVQFISILNSVPQSGSFIRSLITRGFQELSKSIHEGTSTEMKNPMNQLNSNLFSISPVSNKRFLLNKKIHSKKYSQERMIEFQMKPYVQKGNYYCMGGFWGWYNPGSLGHSFEATVDDKEDFERSLAIIQKYGGTYRFHHIACKTVGYKGKGGMNTPDRTKERMLQSCHRLIEKYPTLCKMNHSKKSGFPEIKIKKSNPTIPNFID